MLGLRQDIEDELHRSIEDAGGDNFESPREFDDGGPALTLCHAPVLFVTARLINVLIFALAAYFLGIDKALYSMLTYLSASKTVDFLIEGIEEYTGVTIISPKNEEIGKMIAEKLGRGITVYKGAGGFGKRGLVQEDQQILFTVITRLEISRLKHEIGIIDPNAFVVMNSIKDTRGGMIKKRPLKH